MRAAVCDSSPFMLSPRDHAQRRQDVAGEARQGEDDGRCRRSGAQPHLDHGAQRVLVSTVSKTQQDADAVLLPGINLDQFDPERHRIVAMGSCTTNAWPRS